MIDCFDAVTLPLTGLPAIAAIPAMPATATETAAPCAVFTAATDAVPRWFKLLMQAIRDLGSATKVAARLIKPASSPQKAGTTYNRSYVSQVQHGLIKIEKVSQHFIEAVLTAFGNGRLDCPHLKRDIAKAECDAYASLTWGQVANTGYERLDQWRACSDCINNPAHHAQPTTQPTPEPHA
jgi:hypothetical protein